MHFTWCFVYKINWENLGRTKCRQATVINADPIKNYGTDGLVALPEDKLILFPNLFCVFQLFRLVYACY